jgi:hypothetical protein
VTNHVGVFRLNRIAADGEPVIDTAEFSEDRLYRYLLTRDLRDNPKAPKKADFPCLFIMLNPSTADAATNDPTIRRCIRFATDWGCNRLTVVNLFAKRATNPKNLYGTLFDPIGPENDHFIKTQCIEHVNGIRVAAWGAQEIAQYRGRVVSRQHNLLCLGTTKNGSPKHPLYVKANASLVPFEYP